MAAAAGDRNVGMIYRRLGIVGCQNLMHPPMTIFAICARRCTRLVGLGVITVRVGLLRIGMTLGAGDLLGGGLVDRPLDVGMAIHAGEHLAVDRMRQLVRVDVEADLFAVDFLR